MAPLAALGANSRPESCLKHNRPERGGTRSRGS